MAGSRLKFLRAAAASDFSIQFLETAQRQQSSNFTLLGQRVDIVGENYIHCIHLAAEKKLLGEFRNCPGLCEVGDVFVREFGDQFALESCHPLGCLAAGHHINRAGQMRFGCLAQHVGVQGTAKTLVGADDD